MIERELTAKLTSAARVEKAQAALVLEKVVGAMRTRVTARQTRETQRRKNALETSSLPTKLKDCRSEDVDRSELFIVEGDSALGTANFARNSEFQALLPIRGKILNVQKASIADMLKNAECGAIIQVIGAGSGRTFELPAARYGKIILMTDADVDGAHIRTLLLTLFFRYMRPLVEAGRVYAAVPPLHRVEVIGSGRQKNEMVYTYSEQELQRLLADLRKRGRSWKENIQRYKGLGEMDADQLAETTMDPRRRTLRRVRMQDAAAAERVFDLLMGNDVAPRKDFIVEGAAQMDRDRIDARSHWTLRSRPGSGRTRPWSKASTTAPARSRRSSFEKIRPTWLFTVPSPSTNRAAISALVSPSPISVSTSRSRGVSTSSAGPAATVGAPSR